tara:strand:+ start:615 stop:800 length:186 start_codon:yes stop_codon:yes gene_type:complete
MKTILRDEQLKNLRQTGVISDNEIVLKVGDLYVAENIVTKERRQVDVHNVLTESSKRVLKG